MHRLGGGFGILNSRFCTPYFLVLRFIMHMHRRAHIHMEEKRVECVCGEISSAVVALHQIDSGFGPSIDGN